jgi:hypothetical protein
MKTRQHILTTLLLCASFVQLPAQSQKTHYGGTKYEKIVPQDEQRPRNFNPIYPTAFAISDSLQAETTKANLESKAHFENSDWQALEILRNSNGDSLFIYLFSKNGFSPIKKYKVVGTDGTPKGTIATEYQGCITYRSPNSIPESSFEAQLNIEQLVEDEMHMHADACSAKPMKEPVITKPKQFPGNPAIWQALYTFILEK